MQKDRFNAILADLDKITDDDIKSLNQLRKQYPYFQNQYVMIAKALKERDHPKTDAFVKKAAIYVADRGLLKGIVTGTHSFEVVVEASAEIVNKAAEEEAKRKAEEEAMAKKAAEEAKKAAEEEAKRKAEVEAKRKGEEEAKKAAEAEAKRKAEEAAAKKAAEAEAQKKAKEEAQRKAAEAEAKKKAEEAEAQRKQEQEAAKKVIVPSEKQTESQPTEDNQEMLSELEKDLKEIKEKKRLLAKLLEQSEEKTRKAPAPAEKKSTRSKKSQSELIEKFIQNEPQLDKQKLVSDEGGQTQVDLASSKIKESDKFYTETLAKLMVKQKKYKKAIHIYEQLGLKFPEKRAYFASQIEKVNNKD